MKKLLFSATPLPSRATDVGWLLFRLHLGLSIAIGAGWSKLIHLSTTRDLVKLMAQPGHLTTPDWFVQQVAQLGFTFPSPYFWAALTVWGEFVGGLLVALGLSTRLAAAQLAVQFMVIAFFWYDSPEPVLGMYYQQLLFWAFIAVAAVGPGRYSLDYWLMRPHVVSSAASSFVGWSKPAAATLVLVLLLSTGACWAGGVHSDLSLEPGKVFVLGGGQPGPFRVVARNVGRVSVEVQERLADGAVAAKAILVPGQRATLTFGVGSAALLRNASAQLARLDLRISGTPGLSMGYASQAPQLSAPPSTSVADFRPLLRYDWRGTLTYLDYRTQRPVTLVTQLNGMLAQAQELVLDYQYQEPEGGVVKGFDRLRLLPDGTGLEWDGLLMRLQQREQLPNGTLRLVLEGEGQDDNRAAVIRRTVLIAERQCSIRKEVRFAEAADFLQRNEYRFTR
ncbi:DoxX family protein [Hymenobacter sp. CRA2]|uniref:DoxX family protein n=1 Tax=Hymenobacter sp. CRA2 TaxID=1955620 RepID=UPI00098ED4E4|nr:DoxX family protein [Hymenobacter sp. CRA2]OON65809.1 hypothetical protein B0919_23250 [Hymenobacter sp. CRA2]